MATVEENWHTSGDSDIAIVGIGNAVFYVFYPRCAVPYTSVHGYILGRVPL